MQYLILDTKEVKVSKHKKFDYYIDRYNKLKKYKKAKQQTVGKDKYNSRKMQVVKKKKRNRKSKRSYKNRIPKKYRVYIKSIWWDKRKNEYYRNHKKQCCVCGSFKNVQLHHLHYKNLGFEDSNDLVPMCLYHHELFHELYGSRVDMHREMAEFMEKYFKPF